MTTNEALPLARMLSATVRLPQHVVFREFPAETVVLNLDTGKYHSLNPVGGRMLEMLDHTKSVQEAVRRLQDEFREQDPAVVEADLYQFCLDLAMRGLIEVEVA
ncbi:MAG: PqqD family protein [Actinomycetota bacterium]|nr:PqqD family protein [Actinomycetota bacterium]MDQ3721872.1 PqqD family protein [Actinomycetota bacterium]